MSERATGVQVHLNGEPHTVPVDQTLPDLIASLGLPPQAALIEYNGQALFRADWDRIRLADGDRLEILRVVAGG